MVLGVPAPTTRAAGTRLTGAIWQSDVTDTATFLLNPPTFHGYQTAAQSIPNSAWTALSITTTVVDGYLGHSNSINPSRYTAVVAGYYSVSGCYAPFGNAAGFRAVRLHKNGSPILGSSTYIAPNGGTDTGVPTPTVEVQLAVGDYVEVAGFQSTGGALNTAIDPELRCSLWVRWSHA